VVDMNRRLGGDASLNTPIGDESGSGEWQDWLVDGTPSQERVLVENDEFDSRRKALSEALTVLDNRERHIFEARRLADEPSTLEDLAREFGVSRERIRQIEVRAFEKVTKAVRHRVAAIADPPISLTHVARAFTQTRRRGDGVRQPFPPHEPGVRLPNAVS
jgi:RNA polymerase sigma-32 factor